MIVRARLVALGTGLFALACSSSRTSREPESRPEPPLATLERLLQPDGAALARVRPHGDGFSLEGSVYTSPGHRSARRVPAFEVGARLPLSADGDATVGIGQSPAATMRFRALDAQPARGALDGGRLLYREAWPGTDLTVVTHADHVEWLFVLRDESAPDSFTFDVKLPEGLPKIRPDGAGFSIEDRKGTPRLRVPPAWAIDARGTRRDARLAWDGKRLSVSLDRAGLVHPIVLDPIVETAVWTMRSAGNQPAGGGRAALLGSKLVVVNPNSMTGGGTVDTWEFDGTAWAFKAPAAAPGTRTDFSLASRGSRVVLFGGSSRGVVSTSYLADTWEWDGTTWLDRAPSLAPSVRERAAVATVGSTVLLYGGSYSSGIGPTAPKNLGDTWIWDGTTWTSKTPAASPGLRTGAGMVGNGTGALLFGGETIGLGATTFGDTWQWDGTNWSGGTPAGSPSARVDTVLANPGSVVLFGGRSGVTYYNETYTWSGSAWSKKTPAAMPDPEAGGFAALGTKAYFFGSRTWSWDGTAWTPLTFKSNPAARSGAAMATLGSKIVLFDGAYTADTWEWDGSLWTQKAPATSPTGRSQHAMATLGSKIVLFGGSAISGTSNETWEWDGANWTSKAGTAPPARYGHAMATFGAKIVMFGGMGSVALNDTWEWNGSTWASKSPTTPPSARVSARLAPFGSTLVLFGGGDGAAFGGTPYDDTYEWDGTNWALKSPALKPDARQGMVLSPLGSRLVLFGGFVPGKLLSSTLGDTWTWDGTTWLKKSPTRSPAARSGAAYATLGSEVVIFGGSGAGSFGDTWSGRITLSNGGTCAAGADCDSGLCVEGVCCDLACTGGCQSCLAARKGSGTDGTCGPVGGGSDPKSACKDDGAPTCGLDGMCDGAGACRKYTSSTGCAPRPCTSGTECTSGFCADGICCDKACGGACEACTKALKGFGVDGVCELVPGGTDPRDRCAKDPGTCKADGLCDGAGACRGFAPTGTSCGATTCASGTVTGFTCDGAGTCSSTPKACAPFACADATTCAATCVKDTDCASGFFCAAGGCVAKKVDGTTAADPRECTSGFVADGVCCSAKCDGSCEACDLSATKGTCTPVVGAAKHGKCPAAGADPCTANVCNGIDGSTCAGFAGPETACRPRSCKDAVETLPASCAGTGACPAATTKSCAPYGCDGAACRTACKDDTHCTGGTRCDAGSGKCVAGDVCDGDHTVLKGDGTKQDCAPYKCVGTACLGSCNASSDCAAGFVCDAAAKTCVAAPTGTEDSGGCSLGHGSGPSGVGGLGLLLGAIGVVWTRRRRAALVASTLAAPLASGCSTKALDTPRAPTVTRSDAAVIAQVTRITSTDARLAALLAPGGDRLLRDEEGVVSPGYRAARRTPRYEIGALLAETADQATQVGIGRSPAFMLRVRERGAARVPVTLDAGRALYRGSHPGTDTIVVSDPEHLEWLWLLQDPAETADFDLEIELPKGIAKVEPRGGGLAFLDRDGAERLRMPAAYALDTNGTRRVAELSWHDGVAHVHLDRVGLVAPIVLDPGIETTTWTLKAAVPPASDAAATVLGSKVVLVTSADVRDSKKMATWTWDGTQFALQAPSTQPDVRTSFALATLGTKAVMFGGSIKDSSGTIYTSNETWEWDGTNWTKKAPATSPAARARPGMAALGTKLLVFGGNYETLNWEWDGVNWSMKDLYPTVPAARSGQVMATLGSKIVLYGGAASAGGMLDDTWEWDGTKWTARTPATKPTARWVAGATAVGSKLVMFGGAPTFTSSLSETWEWDGTNWAQRSPATSPSPRGAPTTMVPFGAGAFLFGGVSPSSSGSRALGDAWEWNGTTWASKASWPLPRYGHAVASLGGKVVLFGGKLLDDTVLDDTWEWGGTSWTLKAPTTKPPARADHAMATLGSKVVMFGGKTATALRADTWEWDGTNWTDRTPAVSPGARKEHGMGTRGGTEIVLFGGSKSTTYGSYDAETWTWNGSAWSKSTPLTAPGATANQSFGSVAGKFLMFGGASKPAELWEWDGSVWTPRGSAIPYVQSSGLALNGSKLVLLSAAYTSSTTPTATLTYDGTTWTKRGPTPSPANRDHGFLSPLGNDVVMFGGVSPGGYLDTVYGDTWTVRVSMSNGGACGTSIDCESGFCVSGICCDKACTGGCEACSAATKGAGADGTCEPVKAGTDPKASCKDDGSPTCGFDGTCDGAGACAKYATSTGCTPKACASNADCSTGFCADGVCCDKACAGPCDACSKTMKGFGVDGVCEPVPAGKDPRDKCAVDAGYPTSCKADGFCDGKGACRLAVAGTACGTTTCSGGSVTGSSCDGVGTCSATPKSCAPLKCKDATTCASTCAIDDDCVAGYFCAGGGCVAKKANGETAAEARECTSGVLADGVCCNAACDGPCESCVLAATKGTCTPAGGAPTHGKCPSAGVDACSARACNDSDGKTCAAFVTGVSCRVASCTGGIETRAASCTGTGSCPAAETKKCEPFGCDGVTCRSACTTDDHCTAGYKCDSGKCVAGSTCDGDHTVTSSTSPPHDCAPYKCRGTSCIPSCASSDDCVPGYGCDTASGQCVPSAGGTGDSGGCALGPANGQRPVSGRHAAAVALLLLRRRRR